MNIVEQSCKLLYTDFKSGYELMRRIEYAARNCYASQDKITQDSCEKFIRSLIKRGHEAPLEFADLTFDITTSRAVLAEITRHRLASFCVESQRYIQEAKTGDISFIQPEWMTCDSQKNVQAGSAWMKDIINVEDTYKEMIDLGMQPQEAREVLPNSTACRIIMKANVREWRNIFKLRCDKAAYPQMRSLAKKMLTQAYEVMPDVFEDLYNKYILQNEN